jgi:ketosteroid isomerase-like protein
MTTTDLRKSVQTTNERFSAAFKEGQTDQIAVLYTAEGQLLPPNSDFIKGPIDISAFWHVAIEMGIKEAHLETIELESLGDTAIEVGRYVLLLGDGQIFDNGKYIVIWKNENGTMKLHRDIWNSNKA